jgi:hypothetical protein
MKPTKKEIIYQQNLQRSLTEVYAQIERLLSTIPDDIDEADLTEDQLFNIGCVQALEEEWVVDPEMRGELSCINWT